MSEKIKVIFLDCDGVVNGSAFFKRVHGTRPDPKNEEELLAGCVDPDAVRLLDELLERTGAKVVVSSSWRHCHEGFGFIVRALHMGSKGNGGPGLMHQRSFIDITPHRSVRGRSRGFEIDDWLLAHPEVEQFVILDDDDDMEMHQKRLVRTTTQLGLQRQHIEQAVKMLEDRDGIQRSNRC